jgi:hypothetical protein
MVLAGIEHGVCLPNLCPLLDSQGGNADPSYEHPGEPFDFEIDVEAARHLGLIGQEEA